MKLAEASKARCFNNDAIPSSVYELKPEGFITSDSGSPAGIALVPVVRSYVFHFTVIEVPSDHVGTAINISRSGGSYWPADIHGLSQVTRLNLARLARFPELQ